MARIHTTSQSACCNCNNPDKYTPKTSGFVSYITVLCVISAFLISQWNVLQSWWTAWNAPYSYYSHGMLVPVLAGIAVYCRRHQLAGTAEKPNIWAGLLLLFIYLFCHMADLLTNRVIPQGMAFIAFLYAAILFLKGSNNAKILTPPILLLIFMMPFASTQLDAMTNRFQILSSHIAGSILHLFTGNVSLDGSTIISDALPEPLVVGIPCSGLRLLVSLITFSLFFGMITKGSILRKILLVVMALPIAILVNSLRIALIGFVGVTTYSPYAMYKSHIYSGYLCLVICFAIVFGISYLSGFKITGMDRGVDNIWPKPVFSPGLLILSVFLLSTLFLNVYLPRIQTKGHIDRESIPESIGHWYSKPENTGILTKGALSTGDHIAIDYIDINSGKIVNVFITAAFNASAFHDPHQCLPSDGSTIENEKNMSIHMPKWEVHGKRMLISANGDEKLIFYWYRWKKKTFGSTHLAIFYSMNNAFDQVVSYISSFFDGESVSGIAKSNQIYWYRFTTEYSGSKNDDAYLKDFAVRFTQVLNRLEKDHERSRSSH